MSVAAGVPGAGTVCARVQEMMLPMLVAMGNPVSGSRTTTKLVKMWVDELVEALTSYQPTKPGAVSSPRGDSLLLMSTLNNWAREGQAESRATKVRTANRRQHFIRLRGSKD